MNKEKDKFEQQKDLEKLKACQNQFIEKMDASQAKAETMEKEMMELIKAGKKDQAKRLMVKVKNEKQKVINYQGREALLSKQIVTLEAVMDDSDITDVLKDTNKQLEKAQEKQNDFMDQVEQGKELQAELDGQRDMINDMLIDQDEQDELDDEFAQYEQMAADDMMKNFNNNDANIISQQQTQPQTQKKDDMDDLFAQVLNN